MHSNHVIGWIRWQLVWRDDDDDDDDDDDTDDDDEDAFLFFVFAGDTNKRSTVQKRKMVRTERSLLRLLSSTHSEYKQTVNCTEKENGTNRAVAFATS